MQTEPATVAAGGRRYADPANRYVARFASPWRRALAATIDWAVCYVVFLLVSIPLGMLQTVGTLSRESGDLGGVPGHILQVTAQLLTVVPLVAYFAILLPTSQTLGMRFADIRSVSKRTGRGLSYVVATVRAAVATMTAAAFYAVYLDSTAYDKGQELDSTAQRLLDGSYVLVAAGCISTLVMVVAANHRSIFDRVFGTAVLDELEATDPRVGPWGPLDAFDTAHR